MNLIAEAFSFWYDVFVVEFGLNDQQRKGRAMSEVSGLRIYTNDEIAIIEFEDKGFLGSQTFIGEAISHLETVIEEHGVKVLIFDLERITAVPSDMLGILVGLKNRGLEIRLFNVGPDVQFVLEATNLDELFSVRDGSLAAMIEEAEEV